MRTHITKLQEKMTNKQVIQLFASKEPMLLADCFDNIYCMGLNLGRFEERTKTDTPEPPRFDETWLNSEYDKNIFNKKDVERILKTL